MSQGSQLGPLSFHTFINDIFYYVNNRSLCSFADNNSLYIAATNYNEVLLLNIFLMRHTRVDVLLVITLRLQNRCHPDANCLSSFSWLWSPEGA